MDLLFLLFYWLLWLYVAINIRKRSNNRKIQQLKELPRHKMSLPRLKIWSKICIYPLNKKYHLQLLDKRVAYQDKLAIYLILKVNNISTINRAQDQRKVYKDLKTNQEDKYHIWIKRVAWFLSDQIIQNKWILLFHLKRRSWGNLNKNQEIRTNSSIQL